MIIRKVNPLAKEPSHILVDNPLGIVYKATVTLSEFSKY
jgi:hypothetical protein